MSGKKRAGGRGSGRPGSGSGPGNAFKGDRFTRKAKSQGYAARSVFKLQEIDERFGLFKRGQRVVDLGCSPGSWARYAWEKTDGALVGVDIKETPGIPATFLLKSVYDVSADELREALGGPCDVLLSDMAPNTSGDRMGDHLRQIALVEHALWLADELQADAVVFKVFEGRDAPALVQAVRERFTTVKRVKPEAVRAKSVEFFVVGIGRRG